MARKILCIVGPTATGKSRLGIELALEFGGEVVSADSMQVYRGLNIGTAKLTVEEMRSVPHHMLDVAEPGENYSVARFVGEATRCVDDILARGHLPVVVGGTGLYVDSLVRGRSFAEYPGGGVRENLFALAQSDGVQALHGLLAKYDPESAARIHPNDTKRVVRALEVYFETGKTIAEHNLETSALPPRYDALYIGLNYRDRSVLYSQIDRRVDAMLEAGLYREVQGLISGGLSPGCTAMQAIGYKELAGVLCGKATLRQAVEDIKRASRRLAKRQLTWFLRNTATSWILWENTPDFEIARRLSTAYMINSDII